MKREQAQERKEKEEERRVRALNTLLLPTDTLRFKNFRGCREVEYPMSNVKVEHLKIYIYLTPVSSRFLFHATYWNQGQACSQCFY